MDASFLFAIGLHGIAVIVSECSKQAIPDKGVQAVIAFEHFVVLVMRHPGVDPFAQPMTCQAPGPEFIAKMPVDVVNDLEQHEEAEQAHMHGKQEGRQRNDTRFQHRFNGVKCIGSPGRRIGGPVMHQMNELEKPG